MDGLLIYSGRVTNPHVNIDVGVLDGEFADDMLSTDNYVRLRNYVAKTVPGHLVQISTDTLWDIRKHATHMAQKYKQIPSDFDDDVDKWLEGTSYTTVDKKKFRDIWLDRSTLDRKDRKCKCFVKAETYPTYKFPRPIKSRTDRFKAVMGPIFQAINEHLFANTEYFIKKIPVDQRAKFLFDKFGARTRFDCTDYTSFEAHFVSMMIFAIEYPLYMWLTRLLQSAAKWRQELDTLLNTNECLFKDFVVWCMSRASGEMNTSSGNGWSNKTLYTYVARVKGATEHLGAFEGDDGVTSTIPENCSPTTEDFEKLGWSCKLITVDKFEEASFCGIVSDSIDLINVCDIKAYLADFGWTKQQYLEANDITIKALIRAKGYSAIYQYPGCPIIQSLGYFALRVTNHDVVDKKLKKMAKNNQIGCSRYKSAKMRELFERMDYKIPKPKKTPDTTRELVGRLFGISPDRQIQIEQYLETLTTIQPLHIDLDVDPSWKHCWKVYVEGDGFCPDPLKELQDFKNFIQVYGAQVEDETG